MDCQQVMSLFDFYWFEHDLFTNSPSLPSSSTPPDLEIEKECLKPEISRLQSRHVRSFSDQFSSQISLILESPSPKSVLTPFKHLQTILSGQESVEQEEEEQQQHQEKEPLKIEVPVKQQARVGRRKRNRKSSSKSLSDLEFEELKGFMDLGFVFSEEDINSSLVSIIPGLQRLGNEDKQVTEDEEEEEEEEEGEERSVVEVSRPYLSEAWEVMNQSRVVQHNPLMNWRFPSLSNEIDMKDHLRSWAHTVASTVR